ncbi:hypothetical protein QVD17_32415 [Tagetes erecta]|uniref:Uncharacterized protein n=1 Tax=Tagetes erecta TaxID=13708 RepID=A0AAD8K669_TARER|nr:hypothetical protein QVD17_32415 [Tagetes erecta]
MLCIVESCVLGWLLTLLCGNCSNVILLQKLDVDVPRKHGDRPFVFTVQSIIRQIRNREEELKEMISSSLCGIMFGFQVRNQQDAGASPAVGEIDTKAPFESVKAAVNLFVEASPKADRPVNLLVRKRRPGD